jgi:hypothetical protein
MSNEQECGCGCESHEVTTEDIVAENNFCLNVLIDLLIEKGVITKDEFEKKLDEAEEELEDEADEE